MAATNSRETFRPELQALRAVAVGLVVIYHLWPKHLAGGFIGVDVFFVISGYLITSHLLREVDRSGRIAVTQFWARRIRRLLPAAFAVLLFSAIATFIWLPRAVWQQTFTEIIASAVYGVNWVLAFSATDYLGAENDPSIVQHYWSLSVEEQFYIVWPLLMVLAIALAAWSARRRGREVSPTSRTRAVLVVLLVVVAASFAYSVIETSISQPFAFFITPTRAWEFGAGALLAVAGTGIARVLAVRPVLAAVLSWGGLLTIAAGALLLDGNVAFPGYIALVPVVGTLAVIAAGDPRQWWSPMTVGRLRPIQLVGDLSYSIYLWHWPLIVLFPVVFDAERRAPASVAIIVVSIALAWLTKRFIEDPVRNGAFWKRGRVRSYLIAVVGAAVTVALCVAPLVALSIGQREQEQRVEDALTGEVDCFGAAALAVDGQCADPFAVPDNLDLAFATADLGLLSTKDCKTDAEGGSEVKRCEFGSTAPDATGLVLIGNSHANALASGLAPYSATQNWHLTTYFRQSCLGVVRVAIAGDPSQDCLDWTNKVLAEILANDSISVVIFQSYFYSTPVDFSPEQITEFETNAQAVWKELADAGKSVVVVSDVPGTRPDNAPACIEESGADDDPCWKPRADLTVQNTEYLAAKSTQGVTTIDLDRYFCTEDRCHALIGGVVVYFDSHHLTESYASSLAPFLGAELKKVIER